MNLFNTHRAVFRRVSVELAGGCRWLTRPASVEFYYFFIILQKTKFLNAVGMFLGYHEASQFYRLI